ncbi:Kelch repeat-containing protein [Spongiimicrobium salis]|uniref:Kelch repeat-containing protein n=1 Tax=Spongiimicrobium salis TaxID=1667022 RepID=UPI00374DD54F
MLHIKIIISKRIRLFLANAEALFAQSFPLWCMGFLVLIQACDDGKMKGWHWETITATGAPTARHEAGLVAYKDKILLMGGRRINPTDEFDTKTNTWTAKSPTPIELHHFQPVVVGDAVYLVGAMTGQWPNEKPLDRVIVYYPDKDTYVYSHEIPEHRRRGGAGVVYHNKKIYILGGITNGHMDGYQSWLDEYDPETGEWRVLPDAPDTRDHFQAVVANNKLYAFAGRRTSKRTEQDMALTNSYGNTYDFATGQWEKVTQNMAIPTERAGNAAFSWNNEIVIGGGESLAHESAHKEVEVYNAETGTWHNWPSLLEGRHGSGFAVVGDYVYTASGSGNRGGGPELTSIERLRLPTVSQGNAKESADIETVVYKQWHTFSLPFEGPETSETAKDNPFLNYRLSTTFKHADTTYTIRGFYAADGNAAETGADKGNIWKVRFTPDRIGEWKYAAVLHHEDSIALKSDLTKGTTIKMPNNEGVFYVTNSDRDGVDFRAKGRLHAFKGYYRFQGTEQYWMKGGTNSPENLLGYVDFDDTYRMQASSREGEASTTEEIHKYMAHRNDWKTGDPSWQNGKGKSLIGALNYLASKGMNSAYFLTMNILGDGKDVWPYVDPTDVTRFDVSKLAQWEIVFQHMQTKGILLHMVLQETENETMLDHGNTGAMRQLYFNEMITRFGHHLALNWNLGEENGPASWTPIGQNDRQRKDMAKYIKETDPYKHPVLLHTHSHDPLRKDILDSISGYQYLDGLSLQQDKREMASVVVDTWKRKSQEKGHPWLITMDEIGMWHTAALTDVEDPDHNTLRQYALWGTLLSGAAGVEWYFGARHPHNDLTSEDWRQRDRLWELTKHAIGFFTEHLPYWEMKPSHEKVNIKEAYCFMKEEQVYALYLPKVIGATLDLRHIKGEFEIRWFDPLNGGELQRGSLTSVKAGRVVALGNPPIRTISSDYKDWVCLVKRVTD